jgi:thioredoxin 1
MGDIDGGSRMNPKTQMVAVSDDSFDADVIGASRPVLVKFEADWCGPCQAIKPAVEQVAAEYADRLTVATVDIDRNNRTPHRFGVRGIPTLMLFKNGQVVAQRVGAVRKAEIDAMLNGQV